MKYVIGIYIYDEVEVLDFAGPYEVFHTATRMKQRMQPELPPAFEVFLLADGLRTIHALGNFMVQPHFGIANHPELDVLIIPGGVVINELSRSDVIAWIRKMEPLTRITASICTGAFLLAQAGLLTGKKATTHWEDIEDLRGMFPDVQVFSGKRWIDLGNLISSAGISAGIDMSLHIVERLEGRDLAERTARQMEYDW